MENVRHDAMRGISSGLKVVAWIVLIVGLVAAIAAIVGADQGQEALASQQAQGAIEAQNPAMLSMGLQATGIIGAILTAVMAVMWFLILYAIADALILLLGIEANTRLGIERTSAVAAPVSRSAVTYEESPTRPSPAPSSP